MTGARTLMALVVASLAATTAIAMDRSGYRTARDRIRAELQTRLAHCAHLTANARDFCLKEARGDEKTARAELEARYRPSEQALYQARVVRADAAYEVAREQCDDLAGKARTVCQKDAKGVHVRAVEDAKVARIEARPGDTPAAKAAAVAEARQQAGARRRKADFDAAKARCETQASDLRVRCLDDARRVYGP